MSIVQCRRFCKYCGLFGKELPIVQSCDSLGSVKTKKDLSPNGCHKFPRESEKRQKFSGSGKCIRNYTSSLSSLIQILKPSNLKGRDSFKSLIVK